MGSATGFLGLWAGVSAASGHDWICLLADLGRRVSATFRTSFMERATPRLRKRRGSCVGCFSGVLEVSSLELDCFEWRRWDFFDLNGIGEVAEESIGNTDRDLQIVDESVRYVFRVSWAGKLCWTKRAWLPRRIPANCTRWFPQFLWGLFGN
jgi:hypothetical protein